MKSIKDPAETRKIEGFKALKLLEKAEKDLVDVMVDVRVNKSHEEIQKRCNMMSDYMAYDGPEEDDTRQPQPDEPEEYWINIAEDIIKKSRVLLFFAADKRYSRALEQRYYRQLTDNIIMFQLTMDNFIRRLKGEVKKIDEL
jgi:hypothetical protein